MAIKPTGDLQNKYCLGKSPVDRDN